MAAKTARKIVKIDEDKCTGCGQCVPNCMEGAIQVIDGKARLIGERLCDGLGNCLGTCPEDAITIEERPAEEFDEQAVETHLHNVKALAGQKTVPAHAGCPGAMNMAANNGRHATVFQGCPGSMMRQLKARSHPQAEKSPLEGGTRSSLEGATRPSQLSQWPVQLALVPVAGPIWQDADVLIAADCVAFALADFHERLLAGKTLAIACPKLDDLQPYLAKLTALFGNNPIRSITVAHMEVPCCAGIVCAVREALERSGKDIPVTDITVGIDGEIQAQR